MDPSIHPPTHPFIHRQTHAYSGCLILLVQMELESATSCGGNNKDGAPAETVNTSSMALVGGGGSNPSPIPAIGDIRASEADILSSWKVSVEEGGEEAVDGGREITSELMSSWKGMRDSFIQSCPVAPAVCRSSPFPPARQS